MKTKKKYDLSLTLIFFLLYFIVFQDFALSLIYKITGNAFLTKLLLYSKEIIFLLLFLRMLLIIKYPKYFIVAVLLFLSCVLVSAAISLFNNVGIFRIIENIRGVILLPGFICIGYGIKDKQKFIKHLSERYLPFLVICAFIGILEYLLDKVIGTKNFWLNTIGITDFYSDIKGQGNRLVNGFPGNFYGQYGGEFFSQKRLVGFWMGPLTAAYVLLIPALYYFIKVYEFKEKRILNIIALLIALLAIYLTHTRAIILVFAFAVFIYLCANLKKHYKYKFTLISIVIVGLLFIALKFDKLIAFLYDGSTIGHIDSIKQSIEQMKFGIFGEGFGRYGVYGEIGTESIYLTILGDMGILSLLLYIFIAVYFIFGIIKSEKNIILNLALYSTVAYLITGIISEQLLAFTSIIPFYIIVGCSGNIVRDKRFASFVQLEKKYLDNKFNSFNGVM